MATNMLVRIEKEIFDAELEPLYKLECQLRSKVTNNFNSLDEYRKDIIENILSNELHHRYIIKDNSLRNGILDFKIYTYDDKIEFAKVYLRHLTGIISNIQATEITQLFIGLLNQFRITNIIAETSEIKIEEFFEKILAKKINQLNYYKLSIKTLGKLEVEKWLDNQEIKNEDYSMVFTESIPEDKINEFTEVFTELMNDVIREEKKERFQETPEGLRKKLSSFQSQGIRLIALLLYHNGRLIGITFTLIKNGNEIASQEMTGIRKGFRGKQLGQYLKAKMLSKIRADFPEVKYLTTNCYNSNKPIVRINLRMGYMLDKTVSQFRLTIEALAEASRQQQLPSSRGFMPRRTGM